MVYFDLNDFDESILAPANYEIARLLCSIFVAFNFLEVPQPQAQAMAQLFVDTYAKTLKHGKTVYMEPRTARGILRTFLEKQAKRKVKELLKKVTYAKKGELQIVLDDRHFKIDDAMLKESLCRHIKIWLTDNPVAPKNYKVIDVAFRLAGTGSIGVKRYMFLLKNKDQKNDYLLIDMKESKASSLAPYITLEQPYWQTEAERILAIQHRMQSVSAAHLSSTIFDNEPYIIKELQPIEDKIDFNIIKNSKRDIAQIIADMAILVASAQIRSTGRQGSATTDDLIAFGADDSWHTGLLNYAEEYAKTVKHDYDAFLSDYNSGLLST